MGSIQKIVSLLEPLISDICKELIITDGNITQ